MKNILLITLIVLKCGLSYSQSLLDKTPEQIKTTFGEPEKYWNGLVVYTISSNNDWLGKYANRVFIRYAPSNIVSEYIWVFKDKANYDNAVNTLRYKSTYVKAINFHYFYKQGDYGFLVTEENGFQIKVCASIDLDLYIAQMEGNPDKYKVKLK